VAQVALVGLLALLVLAPGASALRVHGHRVRVYLPPACAGGRARPADVILTCGDAGAALTRMRWHHWNRRVARGRGHLRINGCRPDCASGRLHTFAVKALAYRPRRCGPARHARYQYTRIRVRARGHHGFERHPYVVGCSGTVASAVR
jgi:hypothetical protein